MGVYSLTKSGINNWVKYPTFMAGNEADGDLELINTTVLSSSQASVVFDVSGLGSTYKHLQIRMVTKSTTTLWGAIRVNGDYSASYSWHSMIGDPGISSVTHQSGANDPTCRWGLVDTQFGAFIMDINDAFSESKYPTFKTLGGSANGGYMSLNSGSYYTPNSPALTSIELYVESSTWPQYSRFSVYGLRG